MLFSRNGILLNLIFSLLPSLVKGSGDEPPQLSSQCFKDFKHLMMFYNEPLLDSAGVNELQFDNGEIGASFEGAHRFEVADSLIYALNNSKNLSDSANNFKEIFINGAEFNKQIPAEWATDGKDMKAKAEALQVKLQNYLKSNSKISIPFGWKGTGPHAIALIIEQNDNKTYNLVVVNTSGSSYHRALPDPNNVYPYLIRLWLEFKNIPQEEIFSGNAWFMYALMVFQNDAVLKDIESSGSNAENYFYGSILANFRKYLAPLDKSKNKRIPHQRSGSCTMSSQVASYLYYAADDVTFHLDRVLIGHTMLETFLMDYKSNESFKALITDGFDLIPRKLVRSTASALAQQLLLYLESKFPDSFKHAGLMGAERSAWISKRKEQAINDLRKNKESIDLINKTIALALELEDILDKNPVREDSTLIKITPEVRNIPGNVFFNDGNSQDYRLNRAGNIYASLKENIQRPVGDLNSFGLLYSELKRCVAFENRKAFTCVQDAFRRSPKEWWKLLDTSEAKGTNLFFLKLCTTISLKYSGSDAVPNSLDDVVMLAHLQIGAWKAAVNHDIEQECKPEFALGLSNFKPPLILEGVLDESVTSGSLSTWLTLTTFDPSNLKKLHYLMKSYKALTGGTVHFFGPAEFISGSSNSCNVSTAYDKITKSKINLKLYRKMWDYRTIKARITKERKDCAVKTKSDEWLTGLYVELRIFLGILQSEVSPVFPVYTDLMNFMFSARRRAGNHPFYFSESEKQLFQTSFYDYSTVQLSNSSRFESSFKLHNAYPLGNIPICQELKISQYLDQHIFYRLRHSQAYSPPLNILKFEAWLNYIKGAQDASLFNSPYFLYLTDRILNMPRLLLDKNGDVELDLEKIYVEGFEKRHIKTIFTELMRIIDSDLNVLIGKKGQLSQEQKSLHVKRSVNIAISLVRFLERIDHDNFVSGSTVSNMLSKLYMSFFKFSSLNGLYELDDKMISTVNLVLTYASDIPIRNGNTFLKGLELGLDAGEMKNISRASLARIHWFITRMQYAVIALGASTADDLFNRGFVFHPVKSEVDSRATSSLLQILFLSSHQQDKNWKIQYSENGDIVRASLSGKNLVLAFQLSSGKVFKNGSLQVEKNLVINNELFTQYFTTEEDRIFASQGQISKIGDFIVFVVSNYKYEGNSVVFILSENYVITSKVFVKYNGNWYAWVKDHKSASKELQYLWTVDYHMYVRTISGVNEVETIFKKPDEEEPVVRFTHAKYSIDNSVKISISDFNSHSIWTLLKYDPKPHKTLSKYMKNFTDTDIVVAKKNALLEMLFIFPGLRFAECPNYPVVVSELSEEDQKTHASNFQILNVPGLFLENRQIAIHGIGFSGTLIAKNKDGQKLILAPISEFGAINERKTPAYIEKIPIVGGIPAPQTRFQRLLLAYYSLRAREFGLARELLQPFTSINQNEVFSLQELSVISWISRLKTGGPESFSLQLVSCIHALLNSQKFPQEYHFDAKTSTEAEKDNKVREKQFKAIMDTISSHFYAYSMSIRDLPEKFYIHRIFPQIMSIEMFNKLRGFNSCPSQSSSYTSFSSGSLSSCGTEYISQFKQPKFKSISDELIHALLDSQLDSKYFSIIGGRNEFLNLMGKLVIRQKSNGANEMALYCAWKDPSLFFSKDLMDVFENYKMHAKKSYNKHWNCWEYYSISDVKTVLRTNISKCESLYKNDFDPIRIADSSSVTDSASLLKTLEEDSKKIQIGSSKFEADIKIATFSDIKSFENLSELFKKILPVNFDNVEVDFTAPKSKQSKVLMKLKGSIESFVKENGQYNKFELSQEIQAIKNNIIGFIFYIEARIRMTKAALSTMVENLSMKAGYNAKSYSNAQNSIESLNRFMHHRKQKSFDSLYSCYQRQSVDCIQMKFPQFNWEESNGLMKEIVEFYSKYVFLNYIEFVAENLEKIMRLSNQELAVEVDHVSILLDEMAKIKDFNERLKKPSILNFEFKSKKFRLRSEQVKDVEHLSSIDPKTGLFKSSVIQRMMAAGKTLVLGTISVVQKAMDSTKLSILVPPTSLYQSNLSAMQARTYSFFKIKGHNFIFPRFKYTCTDDLLSRLIPFLKLIIKQMNDVMQSRDYMVLSPDSLQAYLNSYVEMINHYATSENTTDIAYIGEALKLYAQIHRTFLTKSSIILDEIDMTMDPKKELNFPTVENEPLNMLAATLTTDIIEFSIFDKDVEKTGLDIFGNNQSSLTEAGYKDYRALLFKYIEKQLCDPKSIWAEYLIEKEVPILTKENILAFLKKEDIAFMKEWISKVHDAKKSTIADCLVILKLQIWNNLREAMKSSANLNYGATGPTRPNAEYAIPYLAANTPSPSSEFADRWETLNKTLLMLASVPCSKVIAKNMISYLRKSIIEESSLNVKLAQTATYRNVNVLMPDVDIMNLDGKIESNVLAMHEALLKRSPAAIRLLFSYALDEIFSKMKFPVEQITSNALNMASLFGSIQGYSGTIDNVNILPREVVSGAFENHMINEKNNGGISLKLMKDSEDKPILQLEESILKKSIDRIIRHMIRNGLSTNQRDDLSALIDVGAFFKNFKNQQIALGILKVIKRIESVLYYDEESNQVEFVKRSSDPNSKNLTYTKGFISSTDPDSIYKATQSDINKRFTFYDQRHITGSDILQPKSARALMTVGTRVLLRDILQGTLRMRQFMTSQKVHLVTSASACKFYFSCNGSKFDPKNSNIRVSDMIALGAFNEDEKQASENEKLAFVKIDSEVRKFVLEQITESISKLGSYNSRASIKTWFKKSQNSSKQFRDLFIRHIKESPIQWMKAPLLKPAKNVLANYAAYWVEQLKLVTKELSFIDPSCNFSKTEKFSTFQAVLKVMTTPSEKSGVSKKDSLLEFLNDTILERTSGENDAGQVEMQVFTQQLAELDLEKMMQTIPAASPPAANRESFKIEPFVSAIDSPLISSVDSKVVISLDDLLNDPLFSGVHSKIASSACLTDGKRIAISKDIVKLIDFSPERPFKIFSKYTWEGSHILVEVLPEKAGIRAVLLSLESANDALLELNSISDSNSTFWLCDLSGTISFTTDSQSTPGRNILDLIPSSRTLIFDLLIFNGSLDIILSSQYLQKLYLHRWLNSPKYQLRAKFLLLRMKVLADKGDFIFGKESRQCTILNRAARGDKDILTSLKMSAGAYRKLPVTSATEKSFIGSNGRLITKLKVFSTEIIDEVFEAITKTRNDSVFSTSDDSGFSEMVHYQASGEFDMNQDTNKDEFEVIDPKLSEFWYDIAEYNEPEEDGQSESVQNSYTIIDWSLVAKIIISNYSFLNLNMIIALLIVIILLVIAFILFKSYTRGQVLVKVDQDSRIDKYEENDFYQSENNDQEVQNSEF